MTPNTALDTLSLMRQSYINHLLAAKLECVRLAQDFEIGVFNKLLEAMDRELGPMGVQMAERLDDAFAGTERLVQSEEWVR